MIRIIFIFLLGITQSLNGQNIIDKYGAITRSDTLKKNIYLCFTGHEFSDGFEHVLRELQKHKVTASFFLTGYFVENYENLVKDIQNGGHFIGAHSDKHLLYNDWSKRDSLLHSSDKIKADISHNLQKLKYLGIHPKYFMPPYEWYNQRVVEIALELNQYTVNFSPGTRSNADYTTPDMSNYRSSNDILASIYDYEELHGMNGFHLLIHPGTSPLRKDKFYLRLNELITRLKEKDYIFLKF
jgi:peptidoglycan/xylan/chitin deacetylase (PgdA/CDA1 family)